MRALGIVLAATIAAGTLSILPVEAQPYLSPNDLRILEQTRDPPPTESYRLWRDQRESPQQRLQREDYYRQRLGPQHLYGPRQNVPRRQYYRPYR